MRNRWLLGLVVFVGFAPFSVLQSDVVTLKTGERISGKVRGKTADTVIVEYERGKFRNLPQSEVEKIESGPFEFGSPGGGKSHDEEKSAKTKQKEEPAEERGKSDSDSSKKDADKNKPSPALPKSALPLADGVTTEQNTRAQEELRKKGLYFYLGELDLPKVCDWNRGIKGRIRVWQGRKYIQPEAALGITLWMPHRTQGSFTYFSNIQSQGEWLDFPGHELTFPFNASSTPAPAGPCKLRLMVYGTRPVRRMGKIHHDPVPSIIISNTVDASVRFE
jgi:hypothetical protein